MVKWTVKVILILLLGCGGNELNHKSFEPARVCGVDIARFKSWGSGKVFKVQSSNPKDLEARQLINNEFKSVPINSSGCLHLSKLEGTLQVIDHLNKLWHNRELQPSDEVIIDIKLGDIPPFDSDFVCPTVPVGSKKFAFAWTSSNWSEQLGYRVEAEVFDQNKNLIRKVELKSATGKIGLRRVSPEINLEKDGRYFVKVISTGPARDQRDEGQFCEVEVDQTAPILTKPNRLERALKPGDDLGIRVADDADLFICYAPARSADQCDDPEEFQKHPKDRPLVAELQGAPRRSYIVSVFAQDRAGNRSPIFRQTLHVDGQPPRIHIIWPEPRGQVFTRRIIQDLIMAEDRISIEAEDATSVKYCFSKEFDENCLDTDARHVIPEGIRLPATGNKYYIFVEARDKVGHVSVNHRQLIIDRDPPTISIEWNRPEQNDPVAVQKKPYQSFGVTISAEDDSAGVQRKGLQCKIHLQSESGTIPGHMFTDPNLFQSHLHHFGDFAGCNQETTFVLNPQKTRWFKNIMDAQVVLTVRATDNVGRVGEQTSAIWYVKKNFLDWTFIQDPTPPANLKPAVKSEKGYKSPKGKLWRLDRYGIFTGEGEERLYYPIFPVGINEAQIKSVKFDKNDLPSFFTALGSLRPVTKSEWEHIPLSSTNGVYTTTPNGGMILAGSEDRMFLLPARKPYEIRDTTTRMNRPSITPFVTTVGIDDGFVWGFAGRNADGAFSLSLEETFLNALSTGHGSRLNSFIQKLDTPDLEPNIFFRQGSTNAMRLFLSFRPKKDALDASGSLYVAEPNVRKIADFSAASMVEFRNKVYLGSRKGLFEISTSSLEPVDAKGAFDVSKISFIAVSNHKLFVLARNEVFSLSKEGDWHKEPLPEVTIPAYLGTTANKGIFVIGRNNGVAILDQNKWTLTETPTFIHTFDSRTHHAHVDTQNRLWLATGQDEVYRSHLSVNNSSD